MMVVMAAIAAMAATNATVTVTATVASTAFLPVHRIAIAEEWAGLSFNCILPGLVTAVVATAI